MENTVFVDWLNNELRERGWTDSEFARRAELAPSSVSMVMSGHRGPGVEFCLGVARALKIPGDKILRLVGILPQLPGGPEEQRDKEVYNTYLALSPQAKSDIADYVKFKYQKEHDC